MTQTTPYNAFMTPNNTHFYYYTHVSLHLTAKPEAYDTVKPEASIASDWDQAHYLHVEV